MRAHVREHACERARACVRRSTVEVGATHPRPILSRTDVEPLWAGRWTTERRRVLTGTHGGSRVQKDAHVWAGGPPAQALQQQTTCKRHRATDNVQQTTAMQRRACVMQRATCNMLRCDSHRGERCDGQRAHCHLAYLRARGIQHPGSWRQRTEEGTDLNALRVRAAPTDTPSLPVPRYPPGRAGNVPDGAETLQVGGRTGGVLEYSRRAGGRAGGRKRGY